MTTPKGDAIECQSATAVSEAPSAEAGSLTAALDSASELAHLTQELRDTQAELRRLRAFLSHNLRQPLASLSIWAELLNAKHGDALDDQGQRYLRELTSSVQRVAQMLTAEVASAGVTTSDPSLHGPSTPTKRD